MNQIRPKLAYIHHLLESALQETSSSCGFVRARRMFARPDNDQNASVVSSVEQRARDGEQGADADKGLHADEATIRLVGGIAEVRDLAQFAVS